MTTSSPTRKALPRSQTADALSPDAGALSVYVFIVTSVVIAVGTAITLDVADGQLDHLEASLGTHLYSFYPLATAAFAWITLLVLGIIGLRRRPWGVGLPLLVAILPVAVGYAVTHYDAEGALNAITELPTASAPTVALRASSFAAFSVAVGAIASAGLSLIVTLLLALQRATPRPPTNALIQPPKQRRWLGAGAFLLGVAGVAAITISKLQRDWTPGFDLLPLAVVLFLITLCLTKATVQGPSLASATQRISLVTAAFATLTLFWLGWPQFHRSWSALALDGSSSNLHIAAASHAWLVTANDVDVLLSFVMLVTLSLLLLAPTRRLLSAALGRARRPIALTTGAFVTLLALAASSSAAINDTRLSAENRSLSFWRALEQTSIPAVAYSTPSPLGRLQVIGRLGEIQLIDAQKNRSPRRLNTPQELRDAVAESTPSPIRARRGAHTAIAPITLALDSDAPLSFAYAVLSALADAGRPSARVVVEARHPEWLRPSTPAGPARAEVLPIAQHPRFPRELVRLRRLQLANEVPTLNVNTRRTQYNPYSQYERLDLIVIVDQRGLLLTATGGVLPEGCSWDRTQQRPTIPLIPGTRGPSQIASYNLDRLGECIVRIREEYPDEREVTIVAEPTRPFGFLAHIASIVSRYRDTELFTDVSFVPSSRRPTLR